MAKKAKQANRQSKASHPARKVACFCPPTMHDTKPDQLNKARVKGYSKYCQGQAHAKLLNQHVFKPYIWRSHCKAHRSSNNTAHRCSTCKERLCQKCQTNRLTCLLEVLHLFEMAEHIVTDPTARDKCCLCGIHHMLKGRPKPAGQCLGQ